MAYFDGFCRPSSHNLRATSRLFGLSCVPHAFLFLCRCRLAAWSGPFSLMFLGGYTALGDPTQMVHATIASIASISTVVVASLTSPTSTALTALDGSNHNGCVGYGSCLWCHAAYFNLHTWALATLSVQRRLRNVSVVLRRPLQHSHSGICDIDCALSVTARVCGAMPPTST